jgi:hypothetical protein
LAAAAALAMVSAAQAQPRPYIGFVYPAGAQQGTTVQIRIGGQNVDAANEVHVSGAGVQAKVVEGQRRLNFQDMQLLREQLQEIRRSAAKKDEASLRLMAKIEKRMSEFVPMPASASIANVVLVEITVAPDAEVGQRELIVATPRGASNPLVFHVGQLPEISRKPMLTAPLQVLGKEEAALRKRPDDEVEQRITLPCTVNGQIASSEVNRYRFEARKGQRLVLSTQARQLVPFLADAVPGWFQPVMAVYDAQGKEVAYNDDYRFKPDPVIFFEVPKDGEYVFTITDAIYRGREDFVYRVTVGELPFITSIFPAGGHVGVPAKAQVKGWNLAGAELKLPPPDSKPGIYRVTARAGGFVSNPVPFALDTLPECMEKEPNDDLAHAQKVSLPVIVNGRIDRPDDWDVFQFTGHEGETIVADVSARKLDSPLDSIVKLTDATGKVLAYNDDFEDPTAGTNTHHADSYLSVKLPADGTYFIHLGDTARSGGEEYTYRLRIGPPQPDFALFAVPTSVSLPKKQTAAITLSIVRKDGFAGPVQLALKDPPPGILSQPATLAAGQTKASLSVRTSLTETKEPLKLVIEGRAKIAGREVVHTAVPAEDRMQAFLWRHLVPASELNLMVFSPQNVFPLRRMPPAPTPPATKPQVASTDPGKPPPSPKKVNFRIRQISLLVEEGLLTKEFGSRKIAETESGVGLK